MTVMGGAPGATMAEIPLNEPRRDDAARRAEERVAIGVTSREEEEGFALLFLRIRSTEGLR